MFIRVDREQFVNYGRKYGKQKTLEYCQKKFPELKLYDISDEWLGKIDYCCTCYGDGDSLVIYWEHPIPENKTKTKKGERLKDGINGDY